MSAWIFKNSSVKVCNLAQTNFFGSSLLSTITVVKNINEDEDRRGLTPWSVDLDRVRIRRRRSLDLDGFRMTTTGTMVVVDEGASDGGGVEI
jgi:hypothetical protein